MVWWTRRIPWRAVQPFQGSVQKYIDTAVDKIWYITKASRGLIITRRSHFNSLTTEKHTTKFSSANFQKMFSPSYIALRILRLSGKQCGSRWSGSLWATSSRSMLFANSAMLKEFIWTDSLRCTHGSVPLSVLGSSINKTTTLWNSV